MASLSLRWRNARTDGGAQDHPNITALRPHPATMEHPESRLETSQLTDDRPGSSGRSLDIESTTTKPVPADDSTALLQRLRSAGQQITARLMAVNPAAHTPRTLDSSRGDSRACGAFPLDQDRSSTP